MTRKFSSSSVETTLALGISTSATTITVATGTGVTLLGGITLAGGNVDQFTLAIDPDTSSEEIVFVTAVSGDTLTVVRGQAGVSAIAHSGGATVKHVLTSSDLDYFTSGITNSITAASTSTLTNKTVSVPIIISPEERCLVSATAATGTINFDCSTQAVVYYTTNSSANFTLNFRGNSTTTLNSILTTGDSITSVFLNTNGTTAYYPSTIQVDGTTVTPKWQGGTAPTAGNASSIDVYSFTIIKTGTSTFTVLASQTKFA